MSVSHIDEIKSITFGMNSLNCESKCHVMRVLIVFPSRFIHFDETKGYNYEIKSGHYVIEK